MNDPMTILKADHRQVRQLLTKLAETDEGAERNELTATLEKALTLHMNLEEGLVYPLVQREVGEEDAEEAEIEHGLARDGLAKVISMTELPGFGAAVEMLKAGIEHHVHEEETELLPELKERLDRATWLALGDAILQAKNSSGSPAPASQPSTKLSSKRVSKKASAARPKGVGKVAKSAPSKSPAKRS